MHRRYLEVSKSQQHNAFNIKSGRGLTSFVFHPTCQGSSFFIKQFRGIPLRGSFMFLLYTHFKVLDVLGKTYTPSGDRT